MSTITDAVEKKKREDDAKKPKAIDLGHPPKVSVPRDSRKLRRLVTLIVLLIVVAGAIGAGYYYRNELGDYLASWLIKPDESPTEIKNIIDTTKEPLLAVDEKMSISKGVEKKEEPVADEFPQLTISGIVFDPLDPEAIINGQSVKTGEEIEGAYIVEIRKDSVRVRYKGEERVLTHR